MSDKKQAAIVGLLKTSYNMELETVINYVANSVHLDGVRADPIKSNLAVDATEELGHATSLAKRIKVLGGNVPGSMALKMGQTELQPPKDPLDLIAVVEGVVTAEKGAIAQYQKVIDACDGVDPVTQDLCIQLMGDEQEHLRQFKGYLAELKRD